MTMRPWFCSRMVSHTALVQWTEPMRCTSRTVRKSASSSFAKLLSRRMPALLTRMSMRPHSLFARAVIACTCAKSATLAPSAMACPPAARISSTTLSAAAEEPPLPSRAAPRSFTTTLAPRAASPSACARPRPLPAPVTIATRPSKRMVIVSSVVSRGEHRHGQPVRGKRRPLRAFDLDHDAVADERLGPRPHLHLGEPEAGAHAGARAHRREEANLVEAVVDAHGAALDLRQGVVGAGAQKREREEAVRDGAAEGRLGRGARRVDVDELPVLRHLGEAVDDVLRHLDPARDADLLPDAVA